MDDHRVKCIPFLFKAAKTSQKLFVGYNTTIASMGLVLFAYMVDFYGFHAGKYTVRPMNG